MQYITEELRTPVAGEYDVIVVGGGPSGSAAAISAARKGMKTLLLEKTQCLGGMWTSGFINPLFDCENKSGLLAEIIGELKKDDAWGGFWNKSFNYEYMKALLERLSREAGVEVLYDTRYSRPITEAGAIRGVIAENIGGRKAYLGKVVIDASADAAVAYDCGVKCFIGEDGFESCQSMTMMFVVGNVPHKYKEGLMLYEVLEKAFEKQGKGRHSPFRVPYMIPAPNADFAVIQLTHVHGKDPLDAESMTQAVIEGRKQVLECFEALKFYDDDFRDLVLITSAPQMGVRESRRIEGEYTIKAQDLLDGLIPEDSVTVATFGIDIHDSKNTEQHVAHTEPYGIPYRAMLPKGIDGLIVAGKTISGDHVAMASYRVTGDCCAMGEAAGYAAAYAVKNHKSVKEITAKEFLEKPI